MDKERLEKLWKQVEHIGKVERLQYDAMVSLGSVFGEMLKTIEQQEEKLDNANYTNFQVKVKLQEKDAEIERYKDYCVEYIKEADKREKEIEQLKIRLSLKDDIIRILEKEGS